MNKLPKTLLKALMLIKALEPRKYLRLIQLAVYLYREFYIKLRIEPIIKHFVIAFYYKDNQLLQLKIDDLNDLDSISQTLMKDRLNLKE